MNSMDPGNGRIIHPTAHLILRFARDTESGYATMGKVSTDKSVQIFGHYWVFFNTSSTETSRRLNSHGTKNSPSVLLNFLY